MQSEMLMLYKLMILYILDRIDFPMTDSQLTDFFIGKNYTDYFTLHETINDLSEDNFIAKEVVRNKTLYHITEAGGEALSFFFKDISPAARADIDEYLSAQRYQLKEEQSTPADYYEIKHSEYLTECKILDRDSVILEVRVTVSNEAEAERLCNNWKDNSTDIYTYIVTKLLTTGGKDTNEPET
ncbi:MAG: DUF4364 family protein [Lachnospiraceae bacterium]|nr:DUF4364 family protein [Lachnospiraceae bacterium]